jgi:hypothetical protein
MIVNLKRIAGLATGLLVAGSVLAQLPAVGAKAPAIKLKTPDGKAYDVLAKAKTAKATLVVFWFST